MFDKDNLFVKQSSSWAPRRNGSPHDTRSDTPHTRRSGTPRARGNGNPHARRSSTPRPVTNQYHGEVSQRVRSGTPRPHFNNQQHGEMTQHVVRRDPPLRRVHFAPSEEYGPALDIPELNVKPNNRLEPLALQELTMVDVDYDADGDKEITSQPKPARRKRPRHSRNNRNRRLGNDKNLAKKPEKKEHDPDRQPTPEWEVFMRGEDDFVQIFPAVPTRTNDILPSVPLQAIRPKDEVDINLAKDEVDAITANKELDAILAKYDIDPHEDLEPLFPNTPSAKNVSVAPVSPSISITPDLDEILKEVSKIVPLREYAAGKKVTTCRDVVSIMNFETSPILGTKSSAYHYQPQITSSTVTSLEPEQKKPPKKFVLPQQQKPLLPQPPSVLRPAILQKRPEETNARRLKQHKESLDTVATGFMGSNKIDGHASSSLPPIPTSSGRLTTDQQEHMKGIPEEDILEPPMFLFPKKPLVAPRPPTPASFGPLKVSYNDESESCKPSNVLFQRPPVHPKPSVGTLLGASQKLLGDIGGMCLPSKPILPRPPRCPKPPVAPPVSPEDNKKRVPQPPAPSKVRGSEESKTGNIRRRRYSLANPRKSQT